MTWRAGLGLAATVAVCGWLATPWVAWSIRHRRRTGLGGYALAPRAQRQAWYGRPGLTAQWY